MLNEKWVRGGCWDYARAAEDVAFELGLDEDSEVECVGVFNAEAEAHHVALRLDDKYYDAFGFHSEDELLAMWEPHIGPAEVGPLTEDDTILFDEDDERYEEAYEMAFGELQ